MRALTTREPPTQPAATDQLESIAPGELEAVTGGGLLGMIFGQLGQSALAGALQGAATSIQSGGLNDGTVWRGAAAGAVQGLGNAGAALIQSGGQQQ